ncbi:MAG: SGNH/GDSL hydrolase family protein [Gemmatimonadota bacterium]|nr:MAG: SGNH/GDSL hydrolase family protein [Gemmatimonadota bacterium]
MVAFREAKSVSDVDILFLGSSHTYRAFDPRFFDELGWSSMNLGSTAQSPLNTYYMVTPLLDRLAPKVAVIDVYWLVLETTGVEGALDLAQNLPASWAALRMTLATRDPRALNQLVARFLEGQEALERRPVTLRPGDTYVGRGYVEKAADYKEFQEYRPRGVTISDRQLSYLRRVIEELRERGSQVVLVVAPVPQEELQATSNYEEIDARMESWALEMGVAYIDFNKILRLDLQDHFFDNHHLNQEGVSRFLPVFYEEICRLGSWDRLGGSCSTERGL